MVGGYVPRIIPTAWSSLSPRATKPHSHRISFTLAPPTLAARLSVMPGCWRDLGVLAPGADPDLRDAGRRARRRAAGCSLARPPGPTAVHLPGGQPSPHIARDELAEALWRGPDPAAVDARLNPLLSKLRRVFGADAVDGRSTIRLCLSEAWVDLEAAAEAIHRAESSVAQQGWARAWGPALTALFVAERDFLPGEDAPWIDEIRHQLTELRLRALKCYAAAGLGLGGTELAAAVRAARQLTRVAPLRESGYRYLMQALSAQGNLAEAFGVYGQLSECLRDQLGVSPSPATRELYERLLAAT